MKIDTINVDIEFTNENKLLIKVMRGNEVIAQEWFSNKFWRSKILFSKFVNFIREYKDINPEEIKLYLENKWQEHITELNNKEEKEFFIKSYLLKVICWNSKKNSFKYMKN